MNSVENGRTASDVARHYIQQERNLVRKPTDLSFDYDHQAVNYEETITRGKDYTNMIQCLTLPMMRIGMFMKVFSLAVLLFMYHGHGNRSSWTYDFFNISEKDRYSVNFVYSVILLSVIQVFGSVALLVFQSFLADSGKYSRGFRAGSKIFQTSLILDLVSIALRVITFIYAFKFLEDRWWVHLSETRTDYILSCFAHIIQGISSICFGAGVFYMEAYHDEGTYQEFAWVMLGLFGFAGLSEIMLAIFNVGAFYSYLLLFGLSVATLWAFSFEPLLHFHMGKLHDRTINDAVLAANAVESEPIPSFYQAPTAASSHHFEMP